MQGENLDRIWDMAVDWDLKFTDEGQVEIIASRIPASGGDGHDGVRLLLLGLLPTTIRI